MEIIKELYVVLDNRPGALGEFADVLSENHINVETIGVFGDSAKLIVTNTERAKKILEEYDYTVELRDVLRMEMDNKPGELSYLTKRLGHVGINIDYLFTAFRPRDKKVTVLLDVSDIETAMSLFK